MPTAVSMICCPGPLGYRCSTSWSVIRLDQTSRAYLDAGDAKRRAQVEAEERSARKLRDRTRFALIFGLVAVLAAVLAIATSINAAVQRDRAERAGTESLSRQLAAEAIQLSNRDPFLAAQLSMVAYRQAPTREARSALIDLVSGPVPAGSNRSPTMPARWRRRPPRTGR